MPGTAAAKRDDPVSLADVAPTVLRAAGIAVPAAMKGRDLLGGIGAWAGAVAASAELYSETEYPRVAGWSPLHALTDGRWMAISGAGATALYDLQNDPREERDVSAAQPVGHRGAGLAHRRHPAARRQAGGPRDIVRRRAAAAFARLRRQFGPVVARRRWTASGREDRCVESVRGSARGAQFGSGRSGRDRLVEAGRHQR